MRRNVLIVSVILAVVIGAWLYLNKANQSHEEKEEQNKIAKPVSEKSIEEIQKDVQLKVEQSDQSKPKISESAKPSETIAQALKLLDERRYSSDPLVELESVSAEYSYCNDTVMSFSLKNVQLTEKKSAQLEKLNQRCDALQNKYGFLGEIGQTKEIRKAFKAMPSTSPLGDMYRDENTAAIRADYAAYFNRLTTQGIKAQNSQTLTMSAQIMNQPFISVDPVLAEVLGGLDENYIRRTQHNVLSLMSCEYQGGISCQPDAQLMIDKCLENELFCDMSFMDWYQLYTTDAQKSDVEVLLAHYRNL